MERSSNSTSKSLPEFSSEIGFFTEDLSYRLLHKRALRDWLNSVAKKEQQRIGELSVILCSDEHLLQMNRDHLEHDYYTDIITFDYSDELIAGDLFISLDRVRDNAKQRNLKLVDELHRVMVHGVLHLLGYKDKTPEEQREMRQKEDYYLTLRRFV